MSRISSDSALFEFDSDGWLERLRQYERGESLGSLGPYELIAEAGRGGQGVVYRARQPTTGRQIALKRLLAGTLASPESLRRFEREIEAASALNHPGIVAVYGVDCVAGTPLLAMEWVEGVPVTQWAVDRPRTEVLACFLSVCEAVQHAHQRGVLHRDVKPSNVLVDAEGRARLLDFGLARLFQADSSITTSGVFLGTPAYAAPEQIDGGDVDVRADVYSLGAILFELLTGRRLLEGEGIDVLVRVARTRPPPRPSSLVRSIPRDLDAIVLQSLAHERTERYQSVDALAADLRRFLAGAAVLARPPSAWYLLRKLVARNRLASVLVAALVVGSLATGVAYAVLSSRHAERLTEERDKALAASAAAERARQETDDQRRLAEDARDTAQKEERHARDEREKTEAVLSFFREDVFEVDPVLIGHQPSLLELLQSAAPKIPERFKDTPFVAARVRRLLGEAFGALGDYEASVRELRAALATYTQEPSATPVDIAGVECVLGTILTRIGRYEDAEAVLVSAEARPLGDDPRAKRRLFSVYTALTNLYFATSRYDRCDRTIARQLEFASDERERLIAVGSRAAMLVGQRKAREALPEVDAVLAASIAALGEDSAGVASQVLTRAQCLYLLGDLDGAEKEMRRALAIRTRVFGPDHGNTVKVMMELADLLLVSRKSLPEVEDLARRAQAICTASNDGLELARSLQALSWSLYLRLQVAEAVPHALEALALLERLVGRADRRWADCASDTAAMLVSNKQLDEGEQLLDEIARHPFGPPPRRILWLRAGIQERRGNLEGALELYDQAIGLRSTDPRDKDAARGVFKDFAALLRKMGDEAGALEVERQAAELVK